MNTRDADGPIIAGRIELDPAIQHARLMAEKSEAMRIVRGLLAQYPASQLRHMLDFIKAKRLDVAKRQAEATRPAERIDRTHTRTGRPLLVKRPTVPVSAPPVETWMMPVLRAWPSLPVCTREAVLRTCDPLARGRLLRAIHEGVSA